MDRLKKWFELVFVLLPFSNFCGFAIGALFYSVEDSTIHLYGYYLIFFMLLLFCMRVSLIAHEFGHYFVSILTNLKSKRVMFGLGREIKRFKTDDTTFIINKNLIAGANFLGIDNREGIRIKLFINALGGLFANVVLVVISYFLAFSQYSFRNELTVLIGESILVANSILFILSIIPRRVRFIGIPTPNDGLLAIKALFLKEKDLPELKSSRKMTDFLDAYENQSYEEALNILNRLIKEFPDLIPVKINLSLTYIELGELSKSEEILNQIFISNRKDKRYDTSIKNSLAWTLLLINEKKSIEKADEISAEIYKKNKRDFYILGTRGCILIELGKVHEGRILLRKAERHRFNPENSIANLAYLAYSYYLSDQCKAMKDYLKRVEKKYSTARPSEKRLYELLKSKMELN